MSVNFDPPGSPISLQNVCDVLPMNEVKQKDDLIDLETHRMDAIQSDNETKPITEKLDYWYLDLKKNLMNEFDKVRLEFLEEAQQNTLHEKQVQVKEYTRLNQDIKIMREMLIHYEHTMNQKDETEKNLTKALDLFYNKTIAYRRYYQWRVIFIEKKRQDYSLSLAKHFYEEKLKRKILTNWKSLIEREWKQRFILACEKKSKVILNELNHEYKLKYKQLELQLLNANEEIIRLKNNKNEHDESLKKAFLRGVCALNMEAMSVFLKDEQELNTTTTTNEEQYYKYIGLDDISSDEENRSKCSSYRHHTYPSHVYKEYLPNTIYRTEEARCIRSNNHPRHVSFHKQQSTGTNRS